MAPCPAAQPQRANVRTFLCRTQAEKETKGAVYNLNAFNGKLLAGVNNKVILYGWKAGMDDDSHELAHECSHSGHILALYVTVRGEFILVGDLMKSMSLLIYKPEVRMRFAASLARASESC